MDLFWYGSFLGFCKVLFVSSLIQWMTSSKVVFQLHLKHLGKHRLALGCKWNLANERAHAPIWREEQSSTGHFRYKTRAVIVSDNEQVVRSACTATIPYKGGICWFVNSLNLSDFYKCCLFHFYILHSIFSFWRELEWCFCMYFN